MLRICMESTKTEGGGEKFLEEAHFFTSVRNLSVRTSGKIKGFKK
jgi:hypothetical protein